MLATATDTRAARAARLRGLYASHARCRRHRCAARARETRRSPAARRRSSTATRPRHASSASRRRARSPSCAARATCCYIVNDDAELAAEVGADGVHLGRGGWRSGRRAPDPRAGARDRRVLLRRPGARARDGRCGCRLSRVRQPVPLVDQAAARRGRRSICSAVRDRSACASSASAASMRSNAADGDRGRRRRGRRDQRGVRRRRHRVGRARDRAGLQPSELRPVLTSMDRNEALFARAQRTIPAGVNSPVRAFRSVGGTPRFFARGEGPYVWDADGKRYIDYVGSWGPAIVGHAHRDGRVAPCSSAAVQGLSFGAPTEVEVEMAETLARRLHSLDARAARLVGHGGHDVRAAPRARPHRAQQDHQVRRLLPRSWRQPAREGGLGRAHVRSAFVGGRSAGDRGRDDRRRRTTISMASTRRSTRRGDEIAGIIVEPIAGNMNLVKPVAGVPRRAAGAAATGTAPC